MQIWIIEARNDDGSLDLNCEQPTTVFGKRAITGMSDWEMSRVIYARDNKVVLCGDSIAKWPSSINPKWKARVKTW